MDAFQRSLEWGDRIPTGIIYRNRRPSLEDRIPVIKETSLVKQTINPEAMKKAVQKTLNGYY
jgi:2-oxoglutarate ferredoxin oxidoreductase subunit beta